MTNRKGYRVLLVDDSKSSRMMVKRMLLNSGIPLEKIYTAENGQEAMSSLTEASVDLILTDLVMPVMDGFQLIEAIKGSEYSSIPIVPVSSLGAKKDIEAFRRHGIEDYITKSITQDKLNQLLCRVLEISR